jgi:hypothetical protein
MTIATGLAVYKTAPLVLVGESMEGAVCERSLTQTSSKFSLRIWLDKQTLSDHRNSVKLQTLSFFTWGASSRSYAALEARRADVGKHDRVNYPPV